METIKFYLNRNKLKVEGDKKPHYVQNKRIEIAGIKIKVSAWKSDKFDSFSVQISEDNYVPKDEGAYSKLQNQEPLIPIDDGELPF